MPKHKLWQLPESISCEKTCHHVSYARDDDPRSRLHPQQKTHNSISHFFSCLFFSPLLFTLHKFHKRVCSIVLYDHIVELIYVVHTDGFSQHQVQNPCPNTCSHNFCSHRCTSLQKDGNSTDCDPLVFVNSREVCFTLSSIWGTGCVTFFPPRVQRLLIVPKSSLCIFDPWHHIIDPFFCHVAVSTHLNRGSFIATRDRLVSRSQYPWLLPFFDWF